MVTECAICRARADRWHRWRDRALIELEDAAWIVLGYALGDAIARVLYGRHERYIDRG